MLALLAREDIASFDRTISTVTGTNIKRESVPEMPTEEAVEIVEKKEVEVTAPKKDDEDKVEEVK
jgi:hypothetical protein